MSKFITAQENNWKKESWINDFTSDVKLAKNLTEAYANDVLEAIAEDFQPNLTSAIEDLRVRTGLTASEANDIRKVAYAMFKEAEGGPLTGTHDTGGQMDSSGNILEKGGLVPGNVETNGPEMEKVGDPSSESCPACGGEVIIGDSDGIKTIECSSCGSHVMELGGPLTGTHDTGGQMDSSGNILEKGELAPTEPTNPSQMPAISSQKGKTKTSGMEHLKEYQFKKKEEKEEKDENSSKKENTEMNKEELEEEEEEMETISSRTKVEMFRLAKAGKILPLKRKYATNKSAYAYIKKLEAWFQGANEPTLEGDVTSNNPEKLGYPKEMEYPNGPMQVPVGGDSRQWEQKWFEGAANETKKVMGPSGSELAEKKELQRAKRLERLKAIGGK